MTGTILPDSKSSLKNSKSDCLILAMNETSFLFAIQAITGLTISESKILALLEESPPTKT